MIIPATETAGLRVQQNFYLHGQAQRSVRMVVEKLFNILLISPESGLLRTRGANKLAVPVNKLTFGVNYMVKCVSFGTVINHSGSLLIFTAVQCTHKYIA